MTIQANEIFLADGTVEKEETGLLWKTILTPGRLELTPGRGGKRLEKPLIIVEGHSDDPKNEVGLQDLYDAFEDGAMQHVTIPISHENNVLENTGFIRKVRWGNENGKKVLQAAFEFTEPSVREMVERGTIADVSCGILRNYRKQRDGKRYASVLEHVNLTNKPWVDGMGSFTKLSEGVETDSYFFSEQADQIAPLEPEPEIEPSPLKLASLSRMAMTRRPMATKIATKPSPREQLHLASAKRKGLDLAVMHEASQGAMFDYSAKGAIDVSEEVTTQRVEWENKSSMILRQHNVEDALDESFPDCMLVDFTASKALVTDEDDKYWIAGYSVDENGEVDFHSREEWQSFTPDNKDN